MGFVKGPESQSQEDKSRRREELSNWTVTIPWHGFQADVKMSQQILYQ
jgi:hypothetical protein